MFDNITLKINDLPKNYDLCERVKDVYRSDINTYKGKIKNLGIYKTSNCLRIYGSLPKYLNGENITSLNRDGIRLSIKTLEKDIGLELKNAIVCSAEFGTSIITEKKPFEYLNLFGYGNRFKKIECSMRTGLETVAYTSTTGSFGFIAYDKIKEMLKKKQDIPPLFDGVNVLRLEYRIRKKRGIEAKFKNCLSAYNLFDEKVYKKFQKLFYDLYNDIDKMGRLVYVDKSKKVTPLKLLNLLAEEYRQSFPKDYRYCIQQLNEAGKLSPKSLERIRAASRKNDRNVYISDQSALLRELDAKIFDVMMPTELPKS